MMRHRSILACLIVLVGFACVGCEERVVGTRNDWSSTSRGFGTPREDDDPYDRVKEVDLQDRYGSDGRD
jgi:hypothetical protein